MTSLRRRLVAWLLPPLVVVGVVAAAGAYVFMDRRLAAAYDQGLGDIARALAPYISARRDSVTLEMSRQADAIIVAGTSSQVEPAASLARKYRSETMLVEINPEPALRHSTLQRHLKVDDLDLMLDEGPSSLTVLPAPLRAPEFDAILFP